MSEIDRRKMCCKRLGPRDERAPFGPPPKSSHPSSEIDPEEAEGSSINLSVIKKSTVLKNIDFVSWVHVLVSPGDCAIAGKTVDPLKVAQSPWQQLTSPTGLFFR